MKAVDELERRRLMARERSRRHRAARRREIEELRLAAQAPRAALPPAPHRPPALPPPAGPAPTLFQTRALESIGVAPEEHVSIPPAGLEASTVAPPPSEAAKAGAAKFAAMGAALAGMTMSDALDRFPRAAELLAQVGIESKEEAVDLATKFGADAVGAFALKYGLEFHIPYELELKAGVVLVACPVYQWARLTGRLDRLQLAAPDPSVPTVGPRRPSAAPTVDEDGEIIYDDPPSSGQKVPAWMGR